MKANIDCNLHCPRFSFFKLTAHTSQGESEDLKIDSGTTMDTRPYEVLACIRTSNPYSLPSLLATRMLMLHANGTVHVMFRYDVAHVEHLHS